MIRNSLFNPRYKDWGVSDKVKKMLTYLPDYDDGRYYFDRGMYEMWYEATHWKELGYAVPPIYSMTLITYIRNGCQTDVLKMTYFRKLPTW